MIVPDVNLLIYAYHEAAPSHGLARGWWERVMNAREPIGLPWAVATGFIRLVTHRRVMAHPLTPDRAVAHVRSWLERSHVNALEPGPRHLDILEGLFASLGVAGGLTTDAHLAAIAIEHQAELCSSDADFARMPGLRWRNPLVA